MDRDSILEYVKDNLSIAGVTIKREVQEDGEESNQDFTLFPLIIIEAGDSTSETFTSNQVRETLPIKLNLYTQDEPPVQIETYKDAVDSFFRTDYKLGGNVILVSDMDFDETISGEGEVQETVITATVLFNKIF